MTLTRSLPSPGRQSSPCRRSRSFFFTVFVFLLFFCCALPTAFTANRRSPSRSHGRPRGNVNTCLATADLSGRIKNTISGMCEPGSARKARLQPNRITGAITGYDFHGAARRAPFRQLVGQRKSEKLAGEYCQLYQAGSSF